MSGEKQQQKVTRFVSNEQYGVKVKQYDGVFSIVLSAVLCIASCNLENEHSTAEVDCFCDFHPFFKRGGANVLLFLCKGCQLRKRLGSYVQEQWFSNLF